MDLHNTYKEATKSNMDNTIKFVPDKNIGILTSAGYLMVTLTVWLLVHGILETRKYEASEDFKAAWLSGGLGILAFIYAFRLSTFIEITTDKVIVTRKLLFISRTYEILIKEVLHILWNGYSQAIQIITSDQKIKISSSIRLIQGSLKDAPDTPDIPKAHRLRQLFNLRAELLNRVKSART